MLNRPGFSQTQIEGDFVVFLIGMRINKPLKFWKWAAVASKMGPMVAELSRRPELGMLHSRMHFGLPNIMLVQYWRSFEHLRAYATDSQGLHLPAWRAFNQATAGNDDVGIWHETYLVAAGAYENIYHNMPAYGLGRAGTLAPALGRRQSAAGRLGRSDGTDQPTI